MMPRKIGSGNKAQTAFVAAKMDIDAHLAELAAQSGDHFGTSPDAITWSHVGTATHIRERLWETVSFAAGRG